MRKKILGFILCLCFVHFAGSVPSFAAFKCTKKNGRFPKPGSACKSYYECSNWKAKEAKCRGKEHFFPEKGHCVPPKLYPCFEKPKHKECPVPDGKFLKPKTQCKVYYDCCHGIPKEKRCSPGQLFSQTREICDWSELVTCPEDIKTTKNPRPPLSSTALPSSTTDPGENSSDESSSSSDEGSSSEEEIKRSSTKSKTTTPKFTTPDTYSSGEGKTTAEIIITTLITVTEEDISSKSPETSLTTSNFVLSSTTENGTRPNIITDGEFETSSSVNPNLLSSSSSFTISTKEATKPNTDTDSNVEISSLNPDLLSTSSSFTVPTEKDGTKSNINTDSDIEITSLNPDLLSTSSSFTVPTEKDGTKSNINTDSDFTISSSVTPDLPNTSPNFELSTTDSATEANIITDNNSELPFTATRSIFSSTIEKLTKPVIDTLSISTSTVTVAKHISTNDDDAKTSISALTPESTTLTETLESKDWESTTDPSSITESVTFDIICPESDGYYPHPNDRHKFIACISGNIVIMECPSNLVYDHKKKSCQYN